MEETEQETPLLVSPMNEEIIANASFILTDDSVATTTFRRVSFLRVVAAILLLVVLTDLLTCFRNSHETYAYCSASQSSSGGDPIKCISSRCTFGGKCTLDAVIRFDKSSTGVNLTVVNSTSATCAFLEEDIVRDNFGSLTPSSAFCSVATTVGCACNIWAFVAAIIVGTQVLQLVVTHVFFLERVQVCLRIVCGLSHNVKQPPASFTELMFHPMFGVSVFPLALYAMTPSITFIYYGLGTAPGAIFCGGYNVNDDLDVFYSFRPTTAIKLIIGVFLFPLVDVYIFTNVFHCLSWLERGETAIALNALVRMDHTLKMMMLIFMQATSFSAHVCFPFLFLRWSCADDFPNEQEQNVDEDEAQTETQAVVFSTGPIKQQEAAGTTNVAATSASVITAETEANGSGRKLPSTAIRTTFLVSWLKIGMSLGLVMILNTDWKFCLKSPHATGRQCYVTLDQSLASNRNVTVMCGLEGSPYGGGCNVTGMSVYADPAIPSYVHFEDSCNGHFVGLTGQDFVSSSCSAAFSNEAICSWWILLTGTVVGLNVLHFLIQAWYTCRGEIDPQKDMFNVIYYGNDRGGVQANGRFLFNRRNCFLSGMEFIYLAVVALLFIYSAIGVWASEPGCFIGEYNHYLVYKAVKYNYDVAPLILNPLFFALKEAYKLNVFITIQAFRAGKEWSDVIIPLLRFDKSVLYLGLILSQGVIFLWHMCLPCLCVWWKDKPSADLCRTGQEDL